MATKQQFNIYLPAALVRAVKHAAIEKDRSLSAFVESLLRDHLQTDGDPSTDGADGGGDQEVDRGGVLGLQPLPIVYVADMQTALGFYRALGARTVHEGASWSELRLGDAALALHLAQAAAHHDSTPFAPQVELAFVCRKPLEELIERLRAAEIVVEADIVDEAFGRSLTLVDPGGLRIQVNEHDPELYR